MQRRKKKDARRKKPSLHPLICSVARFLFFPHKVGDMVSVHYSTKIKNTSTTVDSSRARDSPYLFKLGVGQAIKAWDSGLLDMCVGEKRKLTIPPNLGLAL